MGSGRGDTAKGRMGEWVILRREAAAKNSLGRSPGRSPGLRPLGYFEPPLRGLVRFAPIRPFALSPCRHYPPRRFSASDMARSINSVARCCVPWSNAAFADFKRWMSLLSNASFTALTKASISCLFS